MRVCFISHSSARGGAERSLLELVAALTRRGVSCVCLLPDHGPLEDLLAATGADTEVVPFKLRDKIEAGTITPLIDRTWPLAQAPDAIAHIAAGRAAGKNVVVVVA